MTGTSTGEMPEIERDSVYDPPARIYRYLWCERSRGWSHQNKLYYRTPIFTTRYNAACHESESIKMPSRTFEMETRDRHGLRALVVMSGQTSV